MKEKFDKWMLGMLLLLTLIVVLEWLDIRILRQTVAVDEEISRVKQEQINNYAEECGDRTDAPIPSR